MFDSSATTYPYPSRRNVTYARGGMVATSQSLAAACGLDILRKRGNAIDAAIATAAALTVVEPTSNGIGSDSFALVWIESEKRLYGLNGSGKSPQNISIEAVRERGHETMPKQGWLPVTTPGTPAAWAELSARFGKLPLIEALAPAIGYARNGYPISPTLGRSWGGSAMAYAKREGAEYAPWLDTFARGGRAPKIGEMWSSPGHAATLEAIGKTCARDFYTGDIARQITDFAAKHGGFLTMDDLAAHESTWVDPISVNYRGYDVWEIPPNGQGIAALIALNILKAYDFTHRDDERTFHLQFEAMKLAFTAAKHFVTDPGHMQIDPQALLTEDYAQKLRAEISERAAEPKVMHPTPGGTVYLCAADDEGNMVSYIQSNYQGFGSGIVIPGTGIAMQNRGADFVLDPTHANALVGGKKTYHTIIPAFMTKQGQAIGPFGVMGGYMQPQGHVQMVMNTVDFGLNPQASLDAPRWQWQQGRKFTIESNFPAHIARRLTSLGHQISMELEGSSFGRGQIIWRNEHGVLAGGCEPRCDSAIASY